MIEKIKDTIQDCNLNFLIGSGLSNPYLKTLGSIEALLTELEAKSMAPALKKLIRISLYKKYFDGVIAKNPKIIAGDAGAKKTLEAYQEFLQVVNSILLKRKSTILSKEVNVFTTNIDVFLEKTLEDLGLEYNDGFNGRFKPVFSLSNFKKSRFKKSLHYDKVAEMPVFNLLKLHGSLSWEIDRSDRIVFSRDLAPVESLASSVITPACIIDVADTSTILSLKAAAAGKSADASCDAFMDGYEKLLVVNPTKEKFKHTLLNQTYYELLRLYSNELEKENTVLFVMGFSFADEHIREITLRAANSNPTLLIYVITYTTAAKVEIEARFGSDNFKNRNIVFIAPPQEVDPPGSAPRDKFSYDLMTINKEIFSVLFSGEEPTDPAPAATVV